MEFKVDDDDDDDDDDVLLPFTLSSYFSAAPFFPSLRPSPSCGLSPLPTLGLVPGGLS
jgi:hypothetical protein